MAAFLKRQGIACYLNIVAGVLGLAGLIATVVSSSISNAYSLSSLPLLIVASVGGIALIALAIYAPNRWGNHHYVSAASVIASIALFAFVLGNTINARIILISGLFSYNSGNMVGWSVFYAAVAAWACYLAATLLLIAGSFMKSVKEPNSKAEA